MRVGGDDDDPGFRSRMANRITELRLAIDLGEIRSATGFRAALQRDGRFRADDPRVIEACRNAGLGGWLIGPPDE